MRVCWLSVVGIIWRQAQSHDLFRNCQLLLQNSSGRSRTGTAITKQRAAWQVELLPCADGLFNLVDYSVHANPLPMRNAKEAVELLEALPYIRVDMADHTKETFKKQLQDLLERHYQAGPFDFPIETKLFILRPINSRESCDARHSGHEGQVPFQFFPNRAT